MPSGDKVTSLLLRLTRATVEKEMQWATATAPRSLTRGTDDVFPLLLKAEYKGQRLALYECRTRDFDIESETYNWGVEYGFAILDSNGDVAWQHRERGSTISNLVQVARESAANVDAIVDALLA